MHKYHEYKIKVSNPLPNYNELEKELIQLTNQNQI